MEVTTVKYNVIINCENMHRFPISAFNRAHIFQAHYPEAQPSPAQPHYNLHFL